MKKKNKSPSESTLLCKKCEFYDKESDSCSVKDVGKCSENEIESCEDFLISEKLVHF